MYLMYNDKALTSVILSLIYVSLSRRSMNPHPNRPNGHINPGYNSALDIRVVSHKPALLPCVCGSDVLL